MLLLLLLLLLLEDEPDGIPLEETSPSFPIFSVGIRGEISRSVLRYEFLNFSVYRVLILFLLLGALHKILCSSRFKLGFIRCGI